MRLPWLAHDEAPGPYITIPQYRFNKTKQHTQQPEPIQKWHTEMGGVPNIGGPNSFSGGKRRWWKCTQSQIAPFSRYLVVPFVSWGFKCSDAGGTWMLNPQVFENSECAHT